MVHSSSDWTSICWKVQISSRLPRIRATSELLSLQAETGWGDGDGWEGVEEWGTDGDNTHSVARTDSAVSAVREEKRLTGPGSCYATVSATVWK